MKNSWILIGVKEPCSIHAQTHTWVAKLERNNNASPSAKWKKTKHWLQRKTSVTVLFFCLWAFRVFAHHIIKVLPNWTMRQQQQVIKLDVNHISTSQRKNKERLHIMSAIQDSGPVDKFRCPHHYELPWEVWRSLHHNDLSTWENRWTKHGKHRHHRLEMRQEGIGTQDWFNSKWGENWWKNGYRMQMQITAEIPLLVYLLFQGTAIRATCQFPFQHNRHIHVATD